MRASQLTSQEIIDINRQQIYSLGKKIQQGEFTLDAVGDYLPGNVLVTNLDTATTIYMNKRGCSMLNCGLDELVEMGPEYYQQFFVKEEIDNLFPSCLQMRQQQDNTQILQFTQRVRARGEKHFSWYFGVVKLLYTPGQAVSNKIMLVVNEASSLGQTAKKINSVLEESDWMKSNFKKFCLLTQREREIIGWLASGKNNPEISDIFGISLHTVKTHRRNIAAKLELDSFAGLYRFATAFGLAR